MPLPIAGEIAALRHFRPAPAIMPRPAVSQIRETTAAFSGDFRPKSTSCSGFPAGRRGAVSFAAI